MSKLNEKKLEKELLKVIKANIPHSYLIDSYYFKNNNLYIKFDGNKVSKVDDFLFILPGWNSLLAKSNKLCEYFKQKNINRIVYRFYDIDFHESVILISPKSTLQFYNCNFRRDFNCCDTDTIELINCDFYSGSVIDVDADKINIEFVHILRPGNILLKSKDIIMKDIYIYSMHKLELYSELISLIDTEIDVTSLKLFFNLIDTKSTELRASNLINIESTLNDEVKNVKAPLIIYNGVDITNSESIKRPIIMERLLNDLKEIKEITSKTIKKDVEETAQMRKQSLEEQAITKVLKRKNT